MKMVDGEHGRIETRKYCAVTIPDILKQQHEWLGLISLIEVSARRELKKTGAVEEELKSAKRLDRIGASKMGCITY